MKRAGAPRKLQASVGKRQAAEIGDRLVKSLRPALQCDHVAGLKDMRHEPRRDRASGAADRQQAHFEAAAQLQPLVRSARRAASCGITTASTISRSSLARSGAAIPSTRQVRVRRESVTVFDRRGFRLHGQDVAGVGTASDGRVQNGAPSVLVRRARCELTVNSPSPSASSSCDALPDHGRVVGHDELGRVALDFEGLPGVCAGLSCRAAATRQPKARKITARSGRAARRPGRNRTAETVCPRRLGADRRDQQVGRGADLGDAAADQRAEGERHQIDRRAAA